MLHDYTLMTLWTPMSTSSNQYVPLCRNGCTPCVRWLRVLASLVEFRRKRVVYNYIITSTSTSTPTNVPTTMILVFLCNVKFWLISFLSVTAVVSRHKDNHRCCCCCCQSRQLYLVIRTIIVVVVAVVSRGSCISS